MVNHSFILAGGAYYIDAIESLMEPNEDYNLSKNNLFKEYDIGDKVFRNVETINKITLEHEPDNPHDKNAIKVFGDGQHIGYIQKKDIAAVNEIMASPNYTNPVIEDIWYGDYKELDEDEDGNPIIVKGNYDVPYVKIMLCERVAPAAQPEETMSTFEETPIEKPRRSALGIILMLLGIFFALMGLLLIFSGVFPDGLFILGVGIFLVIVSHFKRVKK